MQYIPVTPNMRDYNLLDSLGVAPDLERILDYAMLYGATYVELTGNDADIDPLLPTFKWTLDNDILYAILKDGEQMATYFAIGIDFPCHCIVPANFVLGSSDFSACIEDTLRRIASLYPESTTAELYANMGAVPDEKIPEGEEDNWVPVDLGYSIPEILRIENSPKPPLYFKVNPHYEDTLAFKMPYFEIWTTLKNILPPKLEMVPFFSARTSSNIQLFFDFIFDGIIPGHYLLYLSFTACFIKVRTIKDS